MVGGALERDATGVDHVGGHCCIIPGGEWNNKKKSKIKYIVALDGHQRINHTQQSTENTRAQRRRDRRGGSTGMEHGGGRDMIVLGTIELGRGVKN
jgi:hypothetical protein